MKLTDFYRRNEGVAQALLMSAIRSVIKKITGARSENVIESVSFEAADAALAVIKGPPKDAAYEIPEYGIAVTIKDGAGVISSNLKEHDNDPCIEYNAAMTGIESLLLALACEGVDITDPRFKRALQTTLEACADNLD
jgi:hypothetical protein